MRVPFRSIIVILLILCATASRTASPEGAANANAANKSPFVVNLADYAKGDGSDETAAIQAAVDALPPTEWKEHSTRDHPGGLLVIPRPPKFYGISDTIKIVERWNCRIVCESTVFGTRGMPINPYFRWIGPDDGTMFEFRSCMGVKVENLSMTGMDAPAMDRLVEKYKFEPIGRGTKGVTGILIGPENRQQGFFKYSTFENLNINNVAIGLKLGDFPNNGPDIAHLSFRDLRIQQFSNIGIWARSGNLANITIEGLTCFAAEGANHCVRIDGGEVMLVNFADGGRKVNGAAIRVNAGGVQVIKAWSEWWAPFLETGNAGPEWTDRTYGSVNYPCVLQGVRHYDGGFQQVKYKSDAPNPVPLSIVYNRPTPLNLIGCSLWGGVELGESSQAVVVSQGTVFVDKNCVGFTGPGATKHGRVVQIGAPHPDNGRVLLPYVVDRRNQPGVAPPTDGKWAKGDRVLNTEPDPSDPARAWAGWICLEAGEPGRWAPFGRIERQGQ